MDNEELDRSYLILKFYIVAVLVGLILSIVQFCTGIWLYPFMMMSYVIAIIIGIAYLSRLNYFIDRIMNEKINISNGV